MIRRLLGTFFLTPLFFTTGVSAVFLCAFGFAFPPLFFAGQAVILLLIGFTAADAALIYGRGIRFSAKRVIPKILGIGDLTEIEIVLDYTGNFPVRIEVIDELPTQLQKRDFSMQHLAEPGRHVLKYTVKPVNRGVYGFGLTRIYAEGPLRFVRRGIYAQTACEVPVYPSIRLMRETETAAFDRIAARSGSKKLNRIGQSYEFEQITPFVEGDDFRNINWKATGKTRELMVNQFRDERSQNMYCVISKGRSMRLTFDGLSLLDYAVNATLALSNVALKKYDKAGLITFSDKIGTALRAENRRGQLRKILESLYAETERDREPDYELLYRSLDRLAKNRSLVVLFTRFETVQSAERALPILLKIRKKHPLMVVLFKDEMPEQAANAVKNTADDIYLRTLAEKYVHERTEIIKRLRSRGIHALSSTPDSLSVTTINKYLELKARGMI